MAVETFTPRPLPDGRMEVFITALLAHGTIAAAAKAADISHATAYRWLAQGPVKDAYAEARRELMRAAMSKLVAAVTQAVDTLVACMDPEIAPAIRVQAAQALLANALKAQDVLELDARLTAIERQQQA